ncbi:MAG: Ig-like domain-containing protein, partial [Halobacteriaceae archaeon]
VAGGTTDRSGIGDTLTSTADDIGLTTAQQGAGLVDAGEAATATLDGPPAVSWVSPADGDTVAGTASIAIDASDTEVADDSLTVEYTAAGTTYGTTYDSTSGTYTDSLDTTGLPEGDVTFEATATDSAGNTATATITVTVDNDDAPTITWTDPADGDVVAGDVTLRTDGSDTEDGAGTLDVSYAVDGTTVGSGTYTSAGTYDYTWDSTTVGDGGHTLTATATDSAGQSTSASITVTVDNAADTPSVTWVNPTGGETVSGSTTVQLDAADDVDPESELTVEWAVDGGSWQTATYDADSGDHVDAWDTTAVANGDHTLDARVTDTDGNTSATTSVTVTVDNSSTAPSVDSVAVSEVQSRNPHAEFDVSWAASDPDGNLATVEVVLVDDTAGGTEDSTTVDVSGGSASGTAHLKAHKDDGTGHTYTATVTATDGAGQSDSASASVTEQ